MSAKIIPFSFSKSPEVLRRVTKLSPEQVAACIRREAVRRLAEEAVYGQYRKDYPVVVAEASQIPDSTPDIGVADNVFSLDSAQPGAIATAAARQRVEEAYGDRPEFPNASGF